ncbi:MAG: hypothetical protein HXX17_10130 [Geobacteraceae bacterium]|nr:hypothetical protein [Geobacteraceae bacterium]
MVKDQKREILTALKALRVDIHEVMEGFLLRTESEIETLCEYAMKMPAASLKDFAPLCLSETRSLKLKPAKGRIKDLKKIDAILATLLDRIVSMDDKEAKLKPPRKKGAEKVKQVKNPESKG